MRSITSLRQRRNITLYKRPKYRVDGIQTLIINFQGDFTIFSRRVSPFFVFGTMCSACAERDAHCVRDDGFAL